MIGSSKLDLKNSYFANGQVQTYTEGSTTHTFAYDFAKRLYSWNNGSNTVTYDYDKAGNLKNPHTGLNLTFNEANEIIGYLYDDAGNLTQDSKYIYTWNQQGQLTSVKDLSNNVIASYTYNPDGLRKSKTIGSTTYNYHYDGINLIRITNNSGATVWTFTWADGKPVSMTNASGTTYYYVTNFRGDVIRIMDGNGATVASYSYDPWGKVLSASENATVAGQPIRYASYVYDTETQLYYLQARYYDPETARFISRDPNGGDLNNPLSQNLYAYTNDDPVNNVDPDGKNPVVFQALRTLVRIGFVIGAKWIRIGWEKARPYIQQALRESHNYIIEGPGSGGRIIQVRYRKTGAVLFRLDYFPIKHGRAPSLHYHLAPNIDKHVVIFGPSD